MNYWSSATVIVWASCYLQKADITGAFLMGRESWEITQRMEKYSLITNWLESSENLAENFKHCLAVVYNARIYGVHSSRLSRSPTGALRSQGNFRCFCVGMCKFSGLQGRHSHQLNEDPAGDDSASFMSPWRYQLQKVCRSSIFFFYLYFVLLFLHLYSDMNALLTEDFQSIIETPAWNTGLEKRMSVSV